MSIQSFQTWKDVASHLRTAVPFVSEALNVLPLLDSRKIQFAGTDGKSILVNTESWGRFKEELEPQGKWYFNDNAAIATVLLHECLHIILKHQKRGMGVARKRVWAKAVDITVNNIVTDIFTLPPFGYHGDKMAQFKKALAESGTFDERFRNKDTEFIYKTLCEEEPEDEEDDQPPSQVNITVSTGSGSGEDSQSKSQPNDQSNDQQGDSGGADQDDEQDSDSGSGSGGSDQQQKPLDSDMSEALDSGIPEDVEELIDNSMQDYLERNAQYAPSGSALAHEIAEAKKKPPILMSHVLRKIRDVISGQIFDYRKPSRHDAFAILMGSEGRMPSYHDDPSDKLRQLVFALDWSGSMGELERQTCFTLVRDAFKNVKREIRLIGFTDRIVQDEIVTKDTVLASHHTGGTCIASLIDYFENPTLNPDPKYNHKPIRPSAIVIVTDAYDPYSMPLLERWKHKNRMRNIVIASRMDMPGLTFHVDAVDGFPRS